LKAHDLITSPAFILLKAADTFAHPTTAPNQLWQTDFSLPAGRWLGLVLSIDRARCVSTAQLLSQYRQLMGRSLR